MKTPCPAEHAWALCDAQDQFRLEGDLADKLSAHWTCLTCLPPIPVLSLWTCSLPGTSGGGCRPVSDGRGGRVPAMPLLPGRRAIYHRGRALCGRRRWEVREAEAFQRTVSAVLPRIWSCMNGCRRDRYARIRLQAPSTRPRPPSSPVCPYTELRCVRGFMYRRLCFYCVSDGVFPSISGSEVTLTSHVAHSNTK